MLKNKFFIKSLLVLTVIASCTKTESFDVKGDATVKFFTNNESPGNAPKNSINYNVVNIPNVGGSGLVNLSSNVPSTIKFPVFATAEVPQDVEIGAEVDNAFLLGYNESHNTNYVEFPAGFLNTIGLTAHIPKGATRSTDSISITVDATKLNLLTGKAYMVPIKLSTVSNAFAGALTANKETLVTYIVVNVEQRRIKYLATAAEAQGALITPRTAWTVLFNSPPTSIGGTGGILDGSTTSYSRWSASPVQTDINIQSVRNVTGIRLYTTTSATLIPTQIDVYLSEDGINFDLIGSPLRANLTYASSYNYILFYKPISAKYIRLVNYYSTSTNTQNFRITELDVYAN